MSLTTVVIAQTDWSSRPVRPTKSWKPC